MPRQKVQRSETGYTDADKALRAEILAKPAFAMERYLRIQDRDHSGRIMPLKLNACQTKLHALVERVREFNLKRSDAARKEDPSLERTDGPVRIVVGKCRRGGVSTYVEGLAFLKSLFREAFRVLCMAHKGSNAENVFKYARDFYRRWPVEHRHLRPEAERESRSGYAWASGSEFVVQTSGGANAARGFEFDLYHFSECAFYDSYEEVRAAVAAAPRHAWIFEESTANGPAGGFYNRWRGALSIEEVENAFDEKDYETLSRWERAGGFIRFFFSWLEDPAYRSFVSKAERESLVESLTPAEKDLVANHGATLEQIKWRRRKIGELGDASEMAESGLSDEQYFQQEYPTTPEEMFQSTGNLVYDSRILTTLLRRSERAVPRLLHISPDQEPEAVTQAWKSNLFLWEPPVKGALYVVGSDSGQGLQHGDWSVSIVLDRTDGTMAREVALLRCKVGAEEFGDMTTLLAEWYNNAFIVPEANGPGQSCCIQIAKTNRYANVYHRQTLDRVSDDQESNSFHLGFMTTPNSKGAVINATRRALKEGTLELRSKVVIAEHMIFRQERAQNGVTWVYSAPAGDHDDCVMATALAYFGHAQALNAPPVTARAVRARANLPDPDADARRAIAVKVARSHKQSRRRLGREWVDRRTVH